MPHNQTHLLLPIVKGSSSNPESDLRSSSSDSALTSSVIPSLLLYGGPSRKRSASSDGLHKLPSRQKFESLGLSLTQAFVYKPDSFWNAPQLWPEPIKKLKKHEYQRSGGDTRLPIENTSSSSTTKCRSSAESSFDESVWFNERDAYSGDGRHTLYHECSPVTTVTSSLPSSGWGYPVAEDEMQQMLLVKNWEDHFATPCYLHGRGRSSEAPCPHHVVHYVPSVCSSVVTEPQSNHSTGYSCNKPQKKSHQVAVAKQEMHRSKKTNKVRAVKESKVTDEGNIRSSNELLVPFVQKGKADHRGKHLPPIFLEEDDKGTTSLGKSTDHPHTARLQTGPVKRVRDNATSTTEPDQTHTKIPHIHDPKSVAPSEFEPKSEPKKKINVESVSVEVQTEPVEQEEDSVHLQRQAGSDSKKEPRFTLPGSVESLRKKQDEGTPHQKIATPQHKYLEDTPHQLEAEPRNKHLGDIPHQQVAEPQHFEDVPYQPEAKAKHEQQEDNSSVTPEEVSTSIQYRDDDEEFVVRIEGQQLRQLLANSRFGNEEWANTISDQKRYDLASDVMVVVGDKVFRSHRLLLAAHSAWFRTTLKLMEKSPCSAVSVPSIKADIFKILHHWIYSKELKAAARCVPAVYRAAYQLGMTEIIKLCVQEAKRHRISIPSMAPPPLPYPDRQARSGLSQPIVRQVNGKLEHFRRKYENTAVLDQYLRLQPRAFREIVSHRDFLNLHLDTIRALFTEDDLDIRSELEVFDAAYSWLSHDWPGRIAFAQPVLQCVRFTLLSQHEILQLVFHKKNLAAVALPICRDLILKALLFWAAYTTGDLDRMTLPILGDKRRPNVKVRRPARLGRWAAAVRIQTAWRAWLARESLHTKQGAAALIQASYRSYLTRNWLQECSAAAQNLKTVLLQQERCRNLAATVLQSHYKGAWVRKHLKKLARAALVIQKSWRGYQLRTKLKNYEDYYAKRLGDLDMLLVGGLDPFRSRSSTKAGGCASVGGKYWKNIVPVRTTWSWNLATNRWRPEGNLGHARIHHCVVSCYGRIFVMGGIDETKTILNSIEMYDTHKRQWYEMTPMRSARMGFCALFLDGKIFVCGGIGIISLQSGQATLISAVETYHPHEDRWEDETPLLCPRCFTAALRDKYFLYIVGGVEIATDDNGNDISGSVDKVEVYNIIKRQWKSVWNLRSPRHAAVLLNYRHQMLVFGGLSTAKQNVVDTVELYDLVNPQLIKDKAHLPHTFAGMGWVQVPTALSKLLDVYQL